jgi:hypothetical protein
MKPENSEENLKRCTCQECPVYPQCSGEKDERLFCARTNSTCVMNEGQPCICGSCPVYFENYLEGGYYCIKELKE